MNRKNDGERENLFIFLLDEETVKGLLDFRTRFLVLDTELGVPST